MKKPPLIIALLLLAVSCTRYPSAVERTLRFAGENRVELSAFYDRPDVDVRSLYAFEDSLFKTLDFSNLDMYYDARNISASYLEALMNGEGTPVSTCFIDGASGIGYTHGLFCDSQTTTDMIYTCGSESYGRPAGTSMCTKKL